MINPDDHEMLIGLIILCITLIIVTGMILISVPYFMDVK